MGRYYSGDIEGKFWFAVQPSNCADRFGGDCGEVDDDTNFLEYHFTEGHLPIVEAEIQAITDALGDMVKTIDDFFETRDSYNDAMLEEFGISRHDLSEYADLDFGKKIRDCLIENGECVFEAEC